MTNEYIRQGMRRKGFTDAQIDAILDMLAQTDKEARDLGITYKGATPMPSTADEADLFEATLKAARVPEKHQDTLWDIWVDDPVRAARMACAYTAPSVRHKAAPGMTTIEVPTALAAALTRARAQLGDAQLAQMLTSAPQAGASLADDVMKVAGGGTLTSDEKPLSREAKTRTKEQRRSLAALFDEGLKELNQ